ncbi:MAG: Rab family GTPase, partial [Candidatus Hodarchaeota archaeon]
GLDIPELLFLHCYLRQRFEKEIQPTARKPWACILGAGGVPVYLLHNISQTDVEQQLAFLLTAITAYSMDLFEAAPEVLVFSRDGLTSINFFVGENTIFAACNPFSLFQDAKFIANFAKLAKPVFNDIIDPAKHFLSTQIGEFHAARIRERSFSDLVESLKDIYRESSTLEGALAEVKLIKEKETLEEMAAQLKAEEEISNAAKAPVRLPAGVDLKIVILGDPDVGKTTISDSLVRDEFAPEYLMDIGAQSFKHKVRIGKSAISTQIWDPTGKQQLEDVDKDFYAEASGAFIVFDVTKPRSFGTVEQWIDEIWNYSKRGPIPLIILGNKVDQRGLDLLDSVDDSHAFDLAEALDEFTAKKHGFRVSYFPVSAVTGRNLNLALQLISLRSLLHKLGVKSAHELI